MEIHKDKETFTLLVSRDELLEIKDALGLRCLYFDALNRKKSAIARSKSLLDDSRITQYGRCIAQDKIRDMYMRIAEVME